MNKFTSVPTVVINLIADINGDESQGNLPVGVAMRLTYALLKGNEADLYNLRVECADAGWACVVLRDTANADKWRNAYSYTTAGMDCLALNK